MTPNFLIPIILLLTLLGSLSPAHAQLGSVKALVIGIDYLKDDIVENEKNSCKDENPLCLTRPRDDARQVFCALHPSVRQQSVVFIEREYLSRDDYSQSECRRPRYIDNRLRESGDYPSQSSNSKEVKLKNEAERLSYRIDDFIDKLKEGDTAFVYLAGHAFEIAGKAYFVPPINFGPSGQGISPEPVELISIQEDIINRISSGPKQPSHLVLVIDACREDFGESDQSQKTIIDLTTLPNDGDFSTESTFSTGLTPLGSVDKERTSTYLTVFFSTAPGQVASDESGFAKIFASHLSRRQSFSDVVRNTQAKFRSNSSGQTPYLQTNEIEEIYLRGADLNPSP